MLKATAWPYPVFEDVRFNVATVQYGQISFTPVETAKGLLVDCGSLRERTDGNILVNLGIETTPDQIRVHAFPADNPISVKAGLRALCKESKFRRFYPADANGRIVAEIPLNKLRGVAHLEVLYLAHGAGAAANGVLLSKGAVVGIAAKPIVLALDEDWTGETIPVDWLDFESNQLPKEAFIHVELSGGSQTPKVWLNARFRSQIESVFLRTGDNSPVALTGVAMRQFFWQHVWEKVILWAVREESEEEENWPATRIAKMWREKFVDHDWQLPSVDNLDAHGLNELSVRVQHCLLAAQNLSRIQGLLHFQPESRGAV